MPQLSDGIPRRARLLGFETGDHWLSVNAPGVRLESKCIKYQFDSSGSTARLDNQANPNRG